MELHSMYQKIVIMSWSDIQQKTRKNNIIKSKCCHSSPPLYFHNITDKKPTCILNANANIIRSLTWYSSIYYYFTKTPRTMNMKTFLLLCFSFVLLVRCIGDHRIDVIMSFVTLDNRPTSLLIPYLCWSQRK